MPKTAAATSSETSKSIPLPSLKRVLSSGQTGGAAPLGIARAVSGGRAAAPALPEWRTVMSSEERLGVRAKIREAYARHCDGSFEDLLETATALGEELLYQSAPGRLDYFRSGLEFDAAVGQKRAQMLQGQQHQQQQQQQQLHEGSASEGERDAKKARVDEEDDDEDEEGSD